MQIGNWFIIDPESINDLFLKHNELYPIKIEDIFKVFYKINPEDVKTIVIVNAPDRFYNGLIWEKDIPTHRKYKKEVLDALGLDDWDSLPSLGVLVIPQALTRSWNRYADIKFWEPLIKEIPPLCKNAKLIIYHNTYQVSSFYEKIHCIKLNKGSRTSRQSRS